MSEDILILAQGEDKARIEKFCEDRLAGIAALKALAQKHGGTSTYSNGWGLSGVGFKRGSEPEGWKFVQRGDDGCDVWWPKRRGKKNLAIIAEFTAIKLLDAGDLTDLVGTKNSSRYSHGVFTTYGAALETIGDEFVVTIPAGKEHNLTSSRELLNSEYWALKEAAKKVEA